MLHLSALIYNSRVHETGVRSVKLCPSQAFMMAFNELSRNHLLSCSLTDCPNCSMPPRIYTQGNISIKAWCTLVSFLLG